MDRAVDDPEGTFAEAFLQPVLLADEAPSLDEGGRALRESRWGAPRSRLRSADDRLLLCTI